MNLLGFEIASAISQEQLIELLPVGEIDAMIRRKHDLEHQLTICSGMMQRGTFLPYPFTRAAVLLRKAGRYEDEIRLCEYASAWAERVKQEERPNFAAAAAMVAKLQARLPAARAKLLRTALP